MLALEVYLTLKKDYSERISEKFHLLWVLQLFLDINRIKIANILIIHFELLEREDTVQVYLNAGKTNEDTCVFLSFLWCSVVEK